MVTARKAPKRVVRRARGTPPALHSDANPGWGTPMIGRRFAQVVLSPAARADVKHSIDVDYATSAYWQEHWPNADAPMGYLDGAKGRDVLSYVDRCALAARLGIVHQIGSGFFNPPGLDGGEMVQKCWSVFHDDHTSGFLDSGVWFGFSIEQFASLQDVAALHPLSHHDLLTTIVPSRRARYISHPAEMMQLLRKKSAKHAPGTPGRNHALRAIRKLRARADDSPVPGNQPTHASYLTILWSHDSSVADRQRDAAKAFLAEQAGSTSLFGSVAIVGRQL